MTSRVPADLTQREVARRLGMPVEEFRKHVPELASRGFPAPDPLTGRYDPEGVERWRRLRNANLFPELTAATVAKPASVVNLQERLARL